MHPYTPTWETEDLKLLRESTAKFLEREFVPHLKRWFEQGKVDREAWTKAGAMGLLWGSSRPHWSRLWGCCGARWGCCGAS